MFLCLVFYLLQTTTCFTVIAPYIGMDGICVLDGCWKILKSVAVLVISVAVLVVSARIRRMGKVLFSVCLCKGGGWYPSLWSQLLSGGYPWGYPPSLPLARIGVPHRTGSGRKCGAGNMPLAFTQQDFLVTQFKSNQWKENMAKYTYFPFQQRYHTCQLQPARSESSYWEV